MTAPFPNSKSKRDGYNRHQVDEFLELARRAYDGLDTGDKTFRAADLRNASFDLQRGGYSVRYVDAALDRLEDVFFEREKRDALRTYGPEKWQAALDFQSRELRNRAEASRGHRFRRAPMFTTGYSRNEVDLFLDRVMIFLGGHAPLTANEVRDITFHTEHRGYSEDQVDSYLDAVVSYILASR